VQNGRTDRNVINVDKTLVMASDDGIACRVLIQNEQLEQVDTFPYLGSLIRLQKMMSVRRNYIPGLTGGRRSGHHCRKYGKVTVYQFQQRYY